MCVGGALIVLTIAQMQESDHAFSGRLNHINDDVDRKNDARDTSRSTSASCKGEGKEIAAHWNQALPTAEKTEKKRYK